MPGRLNQRSASFRQWQVVVDGLGHVADAHELAVRPFGPWPDPLRHLRARKRGVVAADGHETVDAERFEHAQHLGHVLFFFCRVGAGSPKDAAAAKVMGSDLLDRELAVVLRRSLNKVAEAVLEADDLHPVRDDGLDGDGRNHAVDAGGGPAADEDTESFALQGAGHG